MNSSLISDSWIAPPLVDLSSTGGCSPAVDACVSAACWSTGCCSCARSGRQSQTTTSNNAVVSEPGRLLCNHFISVRWKTCGCRNVIILKVVQRSGKSRSMGVWCRFVVVNHRSFVHPGPDRNNINPASFYAVLRRHMDVPPLAAGRCKPLKYREFRTITPVF